MGDVHEHPMSINKAVAPVMNNTHIDLRTNIKAKVKPKFDPTRLLQRHERTPKPWNPKPK